MNIRLAELIIKKLAERGVRSFCLCPGGRPAPFVETLSRARGLEVLSFFEERSACFFALGRVRRDSRPAAVITTSGTAAAELLPGLLESFYSGLPLALVTADRPFAQSQSGCPQTLQNQGGLFKSRAALSLNIARLEDAEAIEAWIPSHGSLHLNTAFDEPLLDAAPKPLSFSESFFERAPAVYPFPGQGLPASAAKPAARPAGQSSLALRGSLHLSRGEARAAIRGFFKSCQKPLVIAGELREEEKEPVQKFLSAWPGLFFAEPLSQLSHLPEGLFSGERILPAAFRLKAADGILRIGGVPRARFWRDLEKSKTPVLSLSSPPFFPGLARKSLNFPLLAGLPLVRQEAQRQARRHAKTASAAFKGYDESQCEKRQRLLRRHPAGEPAWIARLKESLPGGSKVFLGNSLPIRLWGAANSRTEKAPRMVTGQGGLNGIDGLISRFLGECRPGQNSFAVLGDLSLLYDMAGFWRSSQIPSWTAAVINNFGGRIFSRLYKNPGFLNEHRLSFEGLAKLWGLGHRLFTDPERFAAWPDPEKQPVLVEIQPCQKQTEACFKAEELIWEK